MSRRRRRSIIRSQRT